LVRRQHARLDGRERHLSGAHQRSGPVPNTEDRGGQMRSRLRLVLALALAPGAAAAASTENPGVTAARRSCKCPWGAALSPWGGLSPRWPPTPRPSITIPAGLSRLSAPGSRPDLHHGLDLGFQYPKRRLRRAAPFGASRETATRAWARACSNSQNGQIQVNTTNLNTGAFGGSETLNAGTDLVGSLAYSRGWA